MLKQCYLFLSDHQCSHVLFDNAADIHDFQDGYGLMK